MVCVLYAILNYLHYANIHRPVVAYVDTFLDAGNLLVPCGQVFFSLQTLAPLANSTSACSAGCPLTIWRHGAGMDTIYGIHMAPFPPVLPMVADAGAFPLGWTS